MVRVKQQYKTVCYTESIQSSDSVVPLHFSLNVHKYEGQKNLKITSNAFLPPQKCTQAPFNSLAYHIPSTLTVNRCIKTIPDLCKHVNRPSKAAPASSSLLLPGTPLETVAAGPLAMDQECEISCRFPVQSSSKKATLDLVLCSVS